MELSIPTRSSTFLYKIKKLNLNNEENEMHKI